uniref:Lipoyl-binding domain-containing protein n=1 Tax=uncultured prokaryote TaxID=198431 RepID=A0A0H5Q990_9ZZZZ|nr:hypothetical protein [uncultured prokaryote]
MLDITSLLEDIKQRPYTDVSIKTPHTGVIEFTEIGEGDKVKGASGEFKEIPGTKLAMITREKNPRFIHATQKGIIQKLHKDLDKKFVESGVEIGILRHFLSKEPTEAEKIPFISEPETAPSSPRACKSA